MSLTTAQVSILHELEEAWPERTMVIFGATALGFYYDMTWRKTANVDLIVAVRLNEFPGESVKRPG
jgi:hypothetical protein